MPSCILCSQSCTGSSIHLRTGSYACVACISAREVKLEQLRLHIYELQNKALPSNVWDTVGSGIIWLFIILCLSALFIHLIVSVGLGIVGGYLYGLTSQRSEKIKEPFRRSVKATIDQNNSEISSIYHQLGPIYGQYWDLPPDWQRRRAQVIKRDNGCCRNCGRKERGSRVPFHVHHVIPKSNQDGNHRLENLIFLCEICHSKVDGSKHRIVGAARKQRLKEEKTRGYRYRRRRRYF